MEYPDYLHDAHRDFPLAPEKLIITREMLSDEMKEFLRVNNLPFSKQERLTQTLLPKEGYITGYKLIQYFRFRLITDHLSYFVGSRVRS